MSRRRSRFNAILVVAVASIALAGVLHGMALAQEIAAAGAQAADAEESIYTRSLLQLFKDGGLLMYPILCCSFVMMVFVFERAIALRRGRVIPRPFVKRLLHQISEGQLDREAALRLCAENKSPIATVFAAGIKKWGRAAVEVEQAVLDSGERAANGLRKNVRVFNGISTVSPLLGLLGTVFGMITSFNDMATRDAMGRPELLAGGISEALLTTAFGLTVAIPALVFYLYFIGRVDQLTIEIDALGQDLVNLISAEAAAESAPARSSKRREAA